MTGDPPRRKSRRRVRRGEGEVTQWPRGLTGYVTSGPLDADPSADEDRTANRLALAARLLGVLRSEGRNIDHEIDALRSAEDAFREGRRADAETAVDLLLTSLGESAHRGSTRPDTR